ncbi:MAG: tetratricopeptide repeat protein [Archangium sp.]|nr:tetratricopeptide repeat protein [Archangium sp.]
MASYKDEQKELKQPDEFQKLGAEAVPFLEKHGKQVVTGVGGVLAVGLVIAIGASMSGRGEETASRDFGASLKVLERTVSATAPTEVKPGEEPPFKTEAEKDEAIVKALSDFRGKHAGTKAAVSASLPLGQAYLRQSKPDQALPLIEEYISKAEQNDPLRPAAYEARGYALEAQKKYDEALNAFDLLAKENKTDFMKGMGLYHRARMLLIKGDTAAAAKTLSEIENAAPGSAAARLAKDRITMLTAQGIDVPKPAPVVQAIDAGK